MTFYPLASSSKGNAYIISDGNTNVLLEAGLTMKELRRRSPIPISSVHATFITHEHGDHSRAAAQLINTGMPVYMSEGTARELDLMDAEIIEPHKPVNVGALRVMSFRVWHDAKQPIGFLVYDTRTHERMMFATDTRNLDYAPNHLNYIAIECNYEDRILSRSDKIPEKRKERIRHTHMELNDCIRYLHKLDLSHCTRVYLLHLSAGNSDELRWMQRFEYEFPGIEIRVCKE